MPIEYQPPAEIIDVVSGIVDEVCQTPPLSFLCGDESDSVENNKTLAESISDEITSSVSDYLEGIEEEERKDLRETIELNGQDFFDLLAKYYPIKILDELFITTPEGGLAYPAGLEVSIDFATDSDGKIVFIKFTIDQTPLEGYTPPAPVGDPLITIGGIVVTVEDPDNRSLRLTFVEVGENTRVWHRRLGESGKGYETVGGSVDGERVQYYMPLNGKMPLARQRTMTQGEIDADPTLPTLYTIQSELSEFMGE